MSTNTNEIKTVDNERDGRLLTETQITEAVTLFAVGQTRQQIASHLIETDTALQERLQDSDETTLMKQLSNALRVADPKSEQFSEKYRPLLEQHRTAHLEALKDRYEASIVAYANFLDKQIRITAEQIEALQDTARGIKHHSVNDLSEAESAIKTSAKLVEHQAKLHKERLELLKPSEADSG